MRQLARLEEGVEAWESAWNDVEETAALIDLMEEEGDDSLAESVAKQLAEISGRVEALELQRMLSGEDDDKNAILTIHPGAGGTESQDWASMLLRMYLRWIERNSYEHSVMDLQPGEEAGLKSVSVEVKGDHPYGYLSAEAGIHRLVRLSPFDSKNRRHTSFAAIFVYPEVEEGDEIETSPADLRIDTFRASGAGGQHVNKTDSAVRITHLPTGIVVSCQNERSQHKNKANALKILRARLYQHRKNEEAAKRQAIEDSKSEIAWGHQIRSYVFHPYNLVKDHRTGVETSDTQAVMDGDITSLIRAYLLQKRGKAEPATQKND